MVEALQLLDTKSQGKLLSRHLQAATEHAENMETELRRLSTYNAEVADLARKLFELLVALCNKTRAVNILMIVERRNGMAAWWRL